MKKMILVLLALCGIVQGQGVLGGSGSLYGGGGVSGATGSSGSGFIVAASDATQAWKDRADYVCDGTEDDEQIQSAIDAANAAVSLGDSVVLSSGNFNIANTLVFAPGSFGSSGTECITLVGQGVDNTVMKLSADCDMISLSGGIFHAVRHIKMDGNRANFTGNGIVSRVESKDFHMKSVFISDFKLDGVVIDGDQSTTDGVGWGWCWESVVIEFCEGNGVYIATTGNCPKMNNCKIQDNYKNGVYVANGTNLLISNSELRGTFVSVNGSTEYARIYPDNSPDTTATWDIGDSVRDNTGGANWTGVIFDRYSRKDGQVNLVVAFDGSFDSSDVVTANGIENTTKSETSGITDDDDFKYAGVRYEDAGIHASSTTRGHQVTGCLFTLSPNSNGIWAGYFTTYIVSSGNYFENGAGGVIQEAGGNNIYSTGDICRAVDTNFRVIDGVLSGGSSVLTGFNGSPNPVRYDPPSILDGDSTSVDISVPGAAKNDFAQASFEVSTQGIVLDAQVTASNNVKVTFSNTTGGTIDLAEGYLYVRVNSRSIQIIP